MIRFPRTVWAFLVRDFQSEASYRLAFALSIWGLFFSAMLWYFMALFIGSVSDAERLRAQTGGLDYYSYALVGLMVNRFLETALYSYSGQMRTEQTTGTLEVMLTTPTPLSQIVLAASSWSFLFALLQSSAYLAIGVLLFGVRLDPGSLVGAVAAVACSVLALSGLGILSAAFVLYFKKGNPVDYLISMASLLFGNLLIPPQALPPELAWISKAIPVTYAVDAVRATLLRGAGFAEIVPDLLALLGFAAVLLPVGVLGARLAVRRAKVEGTLVQY